MIDCPCSVSLFLTLSTPCLSVFPSACLSIFLPHSYTPYIPTNKHINHPFIYSCRHRHAHSPRYYIIQSFIHPYMHSVVVLSLKKEVMERLGTVKSNCKSDIFKTVDAYIQKQHTWKIVVPRFRPSTPQSVPHPLIRPFIHQSIHP